MSFKEDFPEYGAIAEHIRHADAENSVYAARRIADAVMGAARFVKRLAVAVVRRPGRRPATSI